MKKNKDTQTDQTYTGRTYAYIAAGLTVAAAVFFGLAFTVLGIYALIASLLLSLAAVAFANVQKRKNNFDKLVIISICAYVVLGVTAALFIGGIIWSATK